MSKNRRNRAESAKTPPTPSTPDDARKPPPTPSTPDDARKPPPTPSTPDDARKPPQNPANGGNPAIFDAPPPSLPLHTLQMQDAELREMLGAASGDAVTAASLMSLWLARSPYLCGGEAAPEDEERLLRLTRRRTAAEAVDALDTALRPLSIIKAPDGARQPPCYSGYGPEWLADIVAAACRAMPSLSWHDAVWSVPLCLLGHLAAAAHRAAGGRTERPMDTTAADEWLLKANGLKPNG